ncbi:MAG: YkgJ family cysteine cluster protein [Spirochaetales bacterium]|nr:YkgJ family cysteine cluster protein [Spirochaetales bacterium]
MIPSLEQLTATLRGKEFHFRCTACGLCCDGQGDVFFSRTELAKIARFLNKSKKDWQELKLALIQGVRKGLFVHSAGSACIFLKNNKCSIYPVRPLQCRTFPFWPSHFRSQKTLKELQKSCPGSAREKGPSFSAEKVFQRIKRTERDFQKDQEGEGAPVSL